jgi:hypothetical protein
LELINSDDAPSDETVQMISDTTADWDINVKIYHHKPSVFGTNWNNCVRMEFCQSAGFL